MARRKTRNELDIVDRMIGSDEELRGAVEQETINSHVASLIFEARSRAGLTQRELAELVGTKQSVIARLEDADYTGHSLSMLVRIANALGSRLEIDIVPARKVRRRA
jgi:ribosome-binding protein aMBF1 (putative translation factor)